MYSLSESQPLRYFLARLEYSERQHLERGAPKTDKFFLGAGFSVLAKNAAGKFLPAGHALRDDLVEVFRRPELKDLSLAKVCTIIEATRTDLLERYLREVFSVASFDP